MDYTILYYNASGFHCAQTLAGCRNMEHAISRFNALFPIATIDKVYKSKVQYR